MQVLKQNSNTSKSCQLTNTLHQEGEVKLIMMMFKELVSEVHELPVIIMDYTFKQIADEMNKWEVVGFSILHSQRRSLIQCVWYWLNFARDHLGVSVLQ